MILVKYAVMRLVASIAVLGAFVLALSLWAGVAEKPRTPKGTSVVQLRAAHSPELSDEGLNGVSDKR